MGTPKNIKLQNEGTASSITTSAKGKQEHMDPKRAT